MLIEVLRVRVRLLDIWIHGSLDDSIAINRDNSIQIRPLRAESLHQHIHEVLISYGLFRGELCHVVLVWISEVLKVMCRAAGSLCKRLFLDVYEHYAACPIGVQCCVY